MDQLDNNLGINVGNLIGHSAVRYYAMGDDCQKAGATEAQIKAMQDVVREGMAAGALGLSVSREKGHFDPQGVHIPALWADEQEIFALADVLRDMATGTIQAGGGQYVEIEGRHDAPPRRGIGRTVVYNSLSQTMRRPTSGRAHGAHRGNRGAGHPRLSDVQPEPGDAGLHDEEHAGVPRPADLAPDPVDAERGKAAALRRSRDPRQAARGSGRQQAGRRGRHLEDLVELHLGQRAGARKEQVDAVQVDRPDRRGAEEARHRRVPRSGRRGDSWKPASCRPRTTSTTRR